MMKTMKKTAKNLDNLLQAEVSHYREDKTDYIMVFHQEIHDDTTESIDRLMSEMEDVYCMTCAILKKWCIIHDMTDEELLLNSSFFYYGGGQVGFSIKVASYY